MKKLFLIFLINLVFLNIYCMEEKKEHVSKANRERQISKFQIYLFIHESKFKRFCCTPTAYALTFDLIKNPITLKEIFDKMLPLLLSEKLLDPEKFIIRFKRTYRGYILDYSNKIDFLKMKVPLLYAFVVPKNTQIDQ